MSGNKIHQHVKCGRRIIFRNGHDGIRKISGFSALYKVDYRLTERVVHDGIKLISQQIAALYAVAFLVGSVLPYLTDNDSVIVEALDALAEIEQKTVGKLVCNIKSPAGCALAQPVFQNALVTADKVSVILIVFPHVGKRIYTPPCFVAVGVVHKAVPLIIRTVL